MFGYKNWLAFVLFLVTSYRYNKNRYKWYKIGYCIDAKVLLHWFIHDLFYQFMFICGTDWFAFFSVGKIQRNINKNTGSRVTRCDRTDLERRYRDIENNLNFEVWSSTIVDYVTSLLSVRTSPTNAFALVCLKLSIESMVREGKRPAPDFQI